MLDPSVSWNCSGHGCGYDGLGYDWYGDSYYEEEYYPLDSKCLRKKGNAIVGVSDWKTLLEVIPSQMRDTMGMIADVNHIKMEGRDVVEIAVPPYPVPISLRGVYYVRRGATNQRLSGPGLESFLLKRRGLHWELAVPTIEAERHLGTRDQAFQRPCH